jgi:hypothetical protein
MSTPAKLNSIAHLWLLGEHSTLIDMMSDNLNPGSRGFTDERRICGSLPQQAADHSPDETPNLPIGLACVSCAGAKHPIVPKIKAPVREAHRPIGG